jgi:hypothetical protein
MTGEASEVSFRAAMEQGTHATVYAPSLKNEPLELKLHGVESGGVWVENQILTDMMLAAMNETVLETTPIFFLPYSTILWGFVMLEDLPSFSSDKLGLQSPEEPA